MLCTARRRTALLVLALLVPLLGPAAAAGDCARPAGDSWTSVPAPDLTAYENVQDDRSGELVALAVDHDRPQQLWVASHEAVLRSTDGGCTWQEAVALPEAPTAELPAVRGLQRLHHLHSGRTSAGAQRVVAIGQPYTLTELTVLRSDAGGAPGSWELTSAAQVTGRLLGTVMAPGDADRMYVVTDRGVLAGLEVHVSQDGGRTWQLRAALDVGGQRPPGTPIGEAYLAVDAADADVLWLSADHAGVLHSRDGGVTWERLEGPRLPAGISVHGSKSSSVVVADRAAAVVHRSGNGGRSWRTSGTGAAEPFRVVAHGLTADRLLALHGPTAPRYYDEVGMSVWRWDAARDAFVDITPDGAPLLYAATVDSSGAFRLHGPGGIWTWTGERPASAARQLDPPPGVRPAQPPPAAPARLRPQPDRLVLRPGQQRQVRVSLELPPRPVDLDLVLLFDTTNSMSGALDALREDAQRLIDQLAARRHRTRFGIAEFQDYPLAPYGPADVRPYARIRDLAPVDAALAGQLSELSVRDDTDIQTSGLTALHQVATGAGQTGVPRPPGAGDPDIAPGQGMSFGDGAVRVVVTFADEPFHDSPAHPGPALGETVTALRAAGARAVGISVAGRPVGAGDDLRRIAAATGAVAPHEIDCGTARLAQGQPLVCDVGAEGLRVGREVQGARFADAIAALVAAVPAPGLAELTAAAPAGLRAAVGPAVALDRRTHSRADFLLTVGCDEVTETALPVVAHVAGERVATSALPVTCARPPGAASAGTSGAPTLALAPGLPAAPGLPGGALPPPLQLPAPGSAVQGAPGSAGATGSAGAVGAAGAPDDDRATDRAHALAGEVPLAAVPLAAGALATAAATAHLLTGRRRASRPSPVRISAQDRP